MGSDETESDNYIYNLAGLWPLAFGGSQRRGNNNNNNLAGLDEYNNDDNLDAFYNEMMGETESENEESNYYDSNYSINNPTSDETESDDDIYDLAGFGFGGGQVRGPPRGGSRRRGNNNYNNNNNNNLDGLDEYNDDNNLDAFYNEMIDETESDDDIYDLAGFGFGGG